MKNLLSSVLLAIVFSIYHALKVGINDILEFGKNVFWGAICVTPVFVLVVNGVMYAGKSLIIDFINGDWINRVIILVIFLTLLSIKVHEYFLR